MKKKIVITVLFMMIGSMLFANSLSIMPLRIDLFANQKSTMLTVKNTSDSPMILQLHLVAWDQKNNEDQYASENSLLAVPSIFTIKPDETQIIRVGLRMVEGFEQEKAYRLYLNEVLPAKNTQSTHEKIRIALRIGIPVFVHSMQKSKQALAWKVRCHDGKDLMVTAKNLGNTYVKVLEVAVKDPQLADSFISKMPRYILLGKERTWTFVPKECPKSGTELKLSVLTDTGRLHAKAVEQ